MASPTAGTTTGGSRVHCCSLNRGGAWLCPCGFAVPTPQTFSTAFPGLGFTNPMKFPTPTMSRGDAPLPAQIRQVRAGLALRGFTPPVPHVLLSITLAGPTPSGSADASRLCRGCSHPYRHLPAQAAPSFSRPLRRPTGAGLPPPLKQQRLTAHEARPERLRHHLRRPHASRPRPLTWKPPLTPFIGQSRCSPRRFSTGSRPCVDGALAPGRRASLRGSGG